MSQSLRTHTFSPLTSKGSFSNLAIFGNAAPVLPTASWWSGYPAPSETFPRAPDTYGGFLAKRSEVEKDFKS